jgi:hypothetical protein
MDYLSMCYCWQGLEEKVLTLISAMRNKTHNFGCKNDEGAEQKVILNCMVNSIFSFYKSI